MLTAKRKGNMNLIERIKKSMVPDRFLILINKEGAITSKLLLPVELRAKFVHEPLAFELVNEFIANSKAGDSMKVKNISIFHTQV